MFSNQINDALLSDGRSGPEALRWKKRRLLTGLREIYHMDVAFISRFSAGMRVFDEVETVPDFQVSGIERGGFSPKEQSYCYRVLQHWVPSVMIDAGQEPGVQDIAATQDLPVGAHVSVPIRLSNNRVFGMLCAFSRQPDASLSVRDQAMFELCAALLARDIEAEGGLDDAEEIAREPLGDAIAAGAFGAELQPIFDLNAMRPVGFELFTRFAPVFGPTEGVFRQARYLDLILPLEEVILRRASSVLREIPGDAFLALNLSAATLLEIDLAKTFAGADPARLVLELTEHEAVGDYDRLGERVAAAQAMGLRIAIDDVGAGYASLRHLLLLRPDVIKIDRALIAGLDGSASKSSFVGALMDHARSTGAQVVAEGIEREEERLAILGLGRCWGQGYLLGRPRPVPAFSARIEAAAAAAPRGPSKAGG